MGKIISRNMLVELTVIINKSLLLHLVCCLYYLYPWCTVKQISDNEIYLLIKYIKRVLWTVAKSLSYIEEARCLKVKYWIHFRRFCKGNNPSTHTTKPTSMHITSGRSITGDLLRYSVLATASSGCAANSRQSSKWNSFIHRVCFILDVSALKQNSEQNSQPTFVLHIFQGQHVDLYYYPYSVICLSRTKPYCSFC